MQRQDVIDTLEGLLEQMKEENVWDASEYAYFKSIYAIEDAIEKLKENEEE